MADAVTGMPDQAPPALDNRTRWAVMGAVLLTMFLSSLDQTVVGTALPRIVTDLKGAELYTWVVTSYLLASTITVPVYGKFSDIFGRKPMLLIGVALFLVGSGLSGLSQNMGQLIAFRTVQGLGAGAIFPLALAIIGDIFTARERGRYQGLFGAVFGLSFIVGPFVGGWITDNVSWHWVFYVNLPVGIAALAVLIAVLPNPARRTARIADLDYLGVVLFSAGVVPLLIGLTNKGQTAAGGGLYDWTDPRVGGLIVLGLVILAAFVFNESRAREPIVPLDLFRGRDYSASMAAVFLFGVAMFSAVIFMPRFYQTVRGVSATASGYYIWPLLVGLMGGSIGSGLVISRIGRYKWILVGSTVVMIAGAVLMTRLTASIADWTLWGYMLLLGLGLGPPMAGFTVVVQNAVRLDRMGAATSTLTFFRQVGGSVGLAVADTVFASAFSDRLPLRLADQGVPQALISVVTRLGGALQGVGNLAAILHTALPAQLQSLVPKIVAGVNNALAESIAQIFWITVVAAVLAFGCTLLLRDQKLRGAEDLRREMVTGGTPARPAPSAPGAGPAPAPAES
ncbi:MAG: MFS transporter [Candidatus Dormibacteraeota bacterium]|nr:MFS transporter [Candidatus Dormibacteraeota bacterium]